MLPVGAGRVGVVLLVADGGRRHQRGQRRGRRSAPPSALIRPVAVDGVVERLADRQVGDPLGVDGQPVGARGRATAACAPCSAGVAGDLGDQRGGHAVPGERGLVGAVVGDDPVGRRRRRPGRSSRRTCPGTGGGPGRCSGPSCVLRSSTSCTPAVFLVILYGPDENGWLSRSTPVSLSGGSGAVAGSDSGERQVAVRLGELEAQRLGVRRGQARRQRRSCSP